MKIMHDITWWEVILFGIGMGAGSDLAEIISNTFLK